MLAKVWDIRSVTAKDSCFLVIKFNPTLTAQFLKRAKGIRAGSHPNTATTINEGTDAVSKVIH